MYAILWETINHFLIYIVEADSEDEALHRFVMHTGPPVVFDPLSGLYSYPNDSGIGKVQPPPMRLPDLVAREYNSGSDTIQVRAVRWMVDGHVRAEVCSRDRVYDIEPAEFERVMVSRHLLLAQTYRAHGRLDQCVRELEAAQALVPTDFAVAHELGGSLARAAQYPRAVEVLAECLGLAAPDPADQGYCHRDLAEAYDHLGERRLAAEHYSEFLALTYDIRDPARLTVSDLADLDADEVQYVRDIGDYVRRFRSGRTIS